MLNILHNKNFFYLFFGRLITNLGDSIYAVTAMWLVYDLTKNPMYSGIASAITFIPQIFQFLVGPLIDKWRLKYIVVITQLIECFLILLIPIGNYFNFLNVWLIIIVMFLAVCASQFSYPAQTSLIPKILKQKELADGNALMNFAYQGTDFILTGLSGLLIIYLGAINIYLIDGFTFLIAAILFAKIKLLNDDKKNLQNENFKESINTYKKDLREGIIFIKNSFIPKFLFPIVIANGLFGMLNAVLPEYSTLKGGNAYYGYYIASLSIGMLIGSLIATKIKHLPVGIVFICSTISSSIIWILSYLIEIPLLSVILFGIANITLGIINVFIFSMFQAMIPESMLGRVFSVIASIAGLFLPIGALVGGFLAKIIGSGYVFLSGGIALAFVSIYWITYPQLRKLPSYLNIEPNNYLFEKVSSK
ncbi:MFS transporter [Bacillus sp. BP-3]|uniref:MFS transporter n=1 Tax=Bacillus sp. BP-3 TaxID=3022773 RepID=UPI00232F51EF|nr:MFS transporter [Bacillus sp. BP-3]MDC2867878.1 MFS transporter [Bacillus sp. BP-3]